MKRPRYSLRVLLVAVAVLCAWLAGREELERDWPDAIDSIQKISGIPAADWDDYYEALDKDGGPTAYVFRCLHCGRHLGYSDCH